MCWSRQSNIEPRQRKRTGESKGPPGLAKAALGSKQTSAPIRLPLRYLKIHIGHTIAPLARLSPTSPPLVPPSAVLACPFLAKQGPAAPSPPLTWVAPHSLHEIEMMTLPYQQKSITICIWSSYASPQQLIVHIPIIFGAKTFISPLVSNSSSRE